MTCFGGGCVLASSLCGTNTPTGPCVAGSTCVEGTCFVTASLCSTSNTSGTCPAGKSCQGGICAVSAAEACKTRVYVTQPVIGVDTKTKLTADGLEFKDSSGDGTLQPYEDWRLNEYCRAQDLVARMSVPEKVGLMSETANIGTGAGAVPQSVKDLVEKSHLRQALIRLQGAASGAQLASYLNDVQKLCEAQPWGVPFLVTTDPSHGFGMDTHGTTGAQSLSASAVVSPWPQPLGLGAINDATVTRQYGDMVRQEFMGMGFRWQLGPMADLATEPRWARVQNTFGENAYHVAKHARACIEGFQGVGDGGLKNGIAATMKHFPGAGANESGKDSHSRTGKYNVYPGGNFKYHQIPFQAAIDVGAAVVMPCYSIFKEQLEYDPEQTGAAFSRGIVTTYMKETLGFSGMVTSDWGTMSTTPWGVEALSQTERVARFLQAGSHQLGSDSFTLVQAAYDQGLITVADIDAAAVKILELSFKLGLFENPYVAASASDAVRSETNRTNGFIAQKKAVVLLKNRAHETPPPLFYYLPDTATKYLPIDGARYADKNGNTQPDVGEYIDDTNGDGTVQVYFDGVVDGLSGSDLYSTVTGFGDYDYTQVGAGTTLPVVKADTAAQADIAIVRIAARKGQYFGYDDGVPLSFDAPFPGIAVDTGLPPAIKDRNRIIDLLRVRDGYTNSAGTAVPAARPGLRIIVVMHMDRPGIVKPFVNGLTTLDETSGEPGSYPTVSNPANVRNDGLGGVDGFLVEFGAYDRAILDVVFNKNLPTTPAGYKYGQSRLPMEIPSSDTEVELQYEDMPADTWNPTYALGAGATY
jgi:beta-glucosidase